MVEKHRRLPRCYLQQYGLAREEGTRVMLRLVEVYPKRMREFTVALPHDQFGRFQDLMTLQTIARFHRPRRSYDRATHLMYHFLAPYRYLNFR